MNGTTDKDVRSRQEKFGIESLTASHAPARPPAVMCVAKPTGFLF